MPLAKGGGAPLAGHRQPLGTPGAGAPLPHTPEEARPAFIKTVGSFREDEPKGRGEAMETAVLWIQKRPR